MTGEKAIATPPPILFACAYNLLDTSNGAALSLYTLLRSLVLRGGRVETVSGTIFDSRKGGERVLEACGGRQASSVVYFELAGIRHDLVVTGSIDRQEMTCREQEVLLRLFRHRLEVWRPRLMLLWGGWLLLEREMMRLAREAGIEVVLYVVSDRYNSREIFKDCSLLITDSRATAELYRKKMGIVCHPLGTFVDRERVVGYLPRQPQYVTFVNPMFDKGISLFLPLVRMAGRVAPEVKFLVVESRGGRWIDYLEYFGMSPAAFPNVTTISHQEDMRGVYGASRVLLLPSFCHESGARVIAEAQLNGIPVLASDTGGSAEMVGRGGRIFAIPEACRENRKTLVGEETVAPWLVEIERLWRDEEYYREMCDRARREAEKHDLERNVSRFLELVGAGGD